MAKRKKSKKDKAPAKKGFWSSVGETVSDGFGWVYDHKVEIALFGLAGYTGYKVGQGSVRVSAEPISDSMEDDLANFSASEHIQGMEADPLH